MDAEGQRGYAPSPGSSRLPPPLPSPGTRPSFPKSLSDKYRLGEELGRGAFGQVYLGLDTRTGEHVAIKQLSLERIPGENLQGIMNEVELLKALNHRNIVKYVGSFKTRSHLYIILEFMENGALSSIIKQSKFGPFPESLVAVYIQQVLQGLAYLHDQGVVHRDIKGANILTTKEGLVKLADFGVAAKLAELEGEAQAGREAANPVGTPYWMAPEVVEMKGSVTTASDIWSVACLAIELLTGSPPYYDLQPMSALYNIVSDPHPPLPPNISSGMRDFLVQCFKKDPTARPTARELLQHSWITYNRRTLKSSWSRTRGMKTRGGGGGPLAEGYTNVSTVVERILQSTADAEAGTGTAGSAGVAGSSGAGSGIDSLTALEQSVGQAVPQRQAAAAHTGSILGNPAALGPVVAAASGITAKRSMFSVAAAASPQASGRGGVTNANAALPPPPSFASANHHQQQQQQPDQDAAGAAGAPAGQHHRLGSGAAAGVASPAASASALEAPLSCRPGRVGEWLQPELDTALSSADDPTGGQLVEQAEVGSSAGSSGGGGAGQRGSSGGSKAPGLASVAEQDVLAVVEASAQSRHEVAEVKRQVAGMRILVFSAGERSFVQEAAAAASCRTLLSLLGRDTQLRSVFLEADGMSALRELLDNPSDRVLESALDLLVLLVGSDLDALSTSCRLGFVPAVLRFALPSTPIDLRLQAAAFAEVLCRSSSSSAQQVVACQGVPFIRDMVDEQQQHAQQLELAAVAVACFLLLLRRSRQPGWALSFNQLLRLLAHHNLPLRLVRVLPRVMQAEQAAAAAADKARAALAARQASAQPHHARAVSMPQSEAELALLSNDELAGAASLALQRSGAGEDSAGSGSASPERTSSPGRPWLARALPGSPNRVSRMRSSRPAASSSPSPDQTWAAGSSGAQQAQQQGQQQAQQAPELEAELRLTQLLDGVVNLLAVMAHGDSSVKARLCQREVLAGLMGLAPHMRPQQQLRVLRWVRQLATDQLVLQALEEAGAVAYAVAQLHQPDSQAMLADALGALHSLCQLSRSRQEQAAERKAAGPLVQLVQQQQPPSPGPAVPGDAAGAAAAAAAMAATTNRSLAISLLCCFAHGGPRSRHEMWAAGGFDTLLVLLKEEAHQAAVLDALSAWLEVEPPRVEARLLEPDSLARLVTLLPAGTAAAAATPGGDGEQLQSLLTSFVRLLQRSPRLAVELAQNGLAPRVVELLKRPGATAALSLLQMLKAMYEHHPRPKEFIVKYRVQQALTALAHGQSATHQVLVRKQAQNLLDAFQVNVVF